MTTVKLRCLLLGDDPDQIFSIEIEGNEPICVLKKMIKQKNTILADVDAGSLVLLNLSLPLDYADSDAQWRILELGSSMWPPLLPSDISSFFNQDDPPEHYLHILVEHPLLPEELALKRQPLISESGPGPRSSQCHPIFAKFVEGMNEIDKLCPTTEELQASHEFTVKSLDSYGDEHARIGMIERSLRDLVDVDVLSSISITDCGRGRSFRPHGVMRRQCERFPRKDFAVYGFTEVSNHFGQGPVLRVQRNYVNYYSAKAREPIRNACRCPAFLIVIAGGYILILGAAVVDGRFMCYHLTSFIPLEGIMGMLERQIWKTARILKLLKSCLIELGELYTNLLPPVSPAFLPQASSTELPRSSNTLSRLYEKLDQRLVHGDMRPCNIVSDGAKQDTIDFDWGYMKGVDLDKFGRWSLFGSPATVSTPFAFLGK